MTKKYSVILTEKQLRAISDAADLQQRLQLGQYREIENSLPIDYKTVNWKEFHEDMKEIGRLLSKHMIGDVDGTFCTLGVGNKNLPESNSILYEIHRVIRYKLSWEKAVEDGIVESEDSPRKFPQMMTVNFDEPMKYSDQPLPKIERIEE